MLIRSPSLPLFAAQPHYLSGTFMCSLSDEKMCHEKLSEIIKIKINFFYSLCVCFCKLYDPSHPLCYHAHGIVYLVVFKCTFADFFFLFIIFRTLFFFSFPLLESTPHSTSLTVRDQRKCSLMKNLNNCLFFLLLCLPF